MKKPPPGGFCTFDHEGGQKFGHHRFLLRFQHMALDILPAHYRTGIPTAFFKLFILKNHFGGFLLHRRCMLYPCELGMANVSSI